MTAPVVTALLLHTQTCTHCRAGAPCIVTERIHDEWVRHYVAEIEQAEAARPVARDAA